MQTTHKDFIGIYDGALSKERCDSIISEFETLLSTNPSVMTRSDGETQFQSQEMGRMDTSVFADHVLPYVARSINEVLDSCIRVYTNEYFSLKSVKASSFAVKLQKTPPRGGYHVWHSEACSRSSMDRALAWMVYLNDVPDGEGETEFLWQGVRVKPSAGTCVIWPSHFTHPHRGNPVYSCNKYIATGWYTYTD